ncbi:hypothetical protein M5K25_016303 [Dendrobium thyrsiflorum]|uniref:Uncharacterized protein n=1 Tax=Dendrobium thyrsiflorum TaxID=117978 RepID=A0ABD0UJC9_DENTH
MTGSGSFRCAKMVTRRVSSNVEQTSRTYKNTSTPVHPDSSNVDGCNNNDQSPIISSQDLRQQVPPAEDGVWLIGDEGAPIKKRGRTTCADIQSMPLGTRVHIEVNENMVPCNIPESILLGSYLGAKFEFPVNIKYWILQSLGVKWRNYKSSLKAAHWDSRPIQEIMEDVPRGVDPVQWCQLERAARNVENAKKQTCPHMMGRVSSVRRQEEMSTRDRLLLWKINRKHKDGSCAWDVN